MIGLVVVSHSPDLANAAVKMALAIGPGRTPAIAVAAGDSSGGFGTSAHAVAEAIDEVASEKGVLVIADLGSSLLNVEMALERLVTVNCPVLLSKAPFVEGLIAAVASAAAGATLEDVEAEARATHKLRNLDLQIDQQRASNPVELAVPGDPRTSAELPSYTATVQVESEHGLHARPSAKLAALIRASEASVLVKNVTSDGAFVDASSITQLMMLGAGPGDILKVEASGDGASDALRSFLLILGESNDSQIDNASTSETIDPRSIKLIGVSAGIALGTATRLAPSAVLPAGSSPVPNVRTADSEQVELEKFHEARRYVEDDLSGLLERTEQRLKDPEVASVLSWSGAVLRDSALINDVEELIGAGKTALDAWVEVSSKLHQQIQNVSSPYQQQRSIDIADIQHRVRVRLVEDGSRDHRNLGASSLEGAGTGRVVVAEALSAADVAQLDPDTCVGIMSSKGSSTSHASILARSLEIPAVVGADPSTIDETVGKQVVFDGSTGELLVEPSEPGIALFQRRRQTSSPSPAIVGPVRTADGKEISVTTNLASLRQLGPACEASSDGIGLLRTELLFSGREQAPTLEEHLQAYVSVAEALKGRPLTIRTFDAARDKPLTFLADSLPSARGLDLTLKHPDVLITQLRAILQASQRFPLRLLFPFVESASDLLKAKKLLQTAAKHENVVIGPDRLAIGAMIENVAGLTNVSAIAKEVDFISIGTNDLSVSVSGGVRDDSGSAAHLETIDEALLQAIRTIADEASSKAISVCGELANNIDAVPLFIGAGVRQVSVRPSRLVAVKSEIARWSSERAAELLTNVLTSSDSTSVTEVVQEARAEMGSPSLKDKTPSRNEEKVEETY